MTETRTGAILGCLGWTPKTIWHGHTGQHRVVIQNDSRNIGTAKEDRCTVRLERTKSATASLAWG
jgi:hypothetical protein